MSERIRFFLTRTTTPARVGLLLGALGALLALLGWFRERGDLIGLVLALLISFVTWGVVSWAIAQAVHEVERDEG